MSSVLVHILNLKSLYEKIKQSPLMKKTLLTIIFFISLSNISFAYIFSDVKTDNYYFDSTQYLYTKNIIRGYTDGTFKTEKKINRAEILKVLLEGNNIELTNSKKSCFKDVPVEAWFHKYVCTAKKLSFIEGYTDNTFKPNQSVSKVEALKMIGKIYNWQIKEKPEAAWQTPYLEYAKNKKLIPEIEFFTEDYSKLTRGSLGEIIYRNLTIKELKKENFTTKTENEIQSKIKQKKFKINSEKIKIVLSWDNSNTDLDLHLITPSNEEINYKRKISKDLKIILETKKNKERLNIEKIEDGNYELFITKSNKQDFSKLKTKVEIYKDDILIKNFQAGKGSGDIWKLFNILNSSEILIMNKIGDCNLIQKKNSYCH